MISVIIPFHNEEENLPVLVDNLDKELVKLKRDYEVILVDDGSTDSYESKFKIQNSKFKVLKHRKRLGKGKALTTGFKASRGDILIFMDADLQDDPSEIEKFLRELESGQDFVNGWRKTRHDNIGKTLPSSIFNFIILKMFLRSRFHDINCGFKALRREILEEIPLYGDNYRFLPLLAESHGFRTAEVTVSHHPRLHGKSKYGIWRIFSGFLDTLTTYFLFRFAERPLHFFGQIGGVFFATGFVTILILTIQRLFFGMLLFRRPALQYAILLTIVGIQIIMTGIIAELLVYLHKKKGS